VTAAPMPIVSHGREPVDAINAMDTSPIGAAQDGVGIVSSLRDWF